MGITVEIIFGIVVLIILVMNIMTRNVYKELKEIPNKTKLSGVEIAKIIAKEIAEEEPHIIKKNGKFLDHYNKSRNVIKLSPEVFDGEDIYAGIIAINTALETDKNSNVPRNSHFNSFLIIISYLMIIIGACLNNANIIHFGCILFVIAFVLEFIFGLVYGNSKDTEETKKYIKKKKVLEPLEEYEEYLYLLAIVKLARLPYSFINDFR